MTVSLHYEYDGPVDRWKAKSKIALVFPNGQLCQDKYSCIHSIFPFLKHFNYGRMKADEIWVGVALANESGLTGH